jgi:hypothetical protein
MADKNVAVFGIYSTLRAVGQTTEALAEAGVPASDVSVLMPEGLAVSDDAKSGQV